jgi:hypothetical protein
MRSAMHPLGCSMTRVRRVASKDPPQGLGGLGVEANGYQGQSLSLRGVSMPQIDVPWPVRNVGKP